MDKTNFLNPAWDNAELDPRRNPNGDYRDSCQ